MSTGFLTLLGHISRIGVALLPWAFSLYLQYRLEYGSLWAVDMPYRGLLSALLIGAGMLTSLWVYSRLKAQGLD
jgi:hypothetical protein